MAFTADTLNVVLQTIGGVGPRWFFYQTDDSSATVLGEAYFLDVAVRGMKVHDLIFIVPLAGDYEPYTVTVDVVDADGNGTVIRDQPIDTAFFASRAAAAAQRIPSNIQAFMTGGYAEAGDGGGALYVRSETEPTHGFQSLDGAWWELTDRTEGGQKIINPLAYGITDNGDATETTTIANAMHDGLEDAKVIWPPIIVNLNDAMRVLGDNVETVFSAGTVFRQHSWGRMAILTADPDDNTVRPNGQSFVGPARFEAWIDGELANFHHAFYGEADVGETVLTVECETTSTADNLYVFRANAILTPPTLMENGTDYTVTGYGTEELTITLDDAIASGDRIIIKVTNKWDLYSYPFTPLFAAGPGPRSNESAAIWYGGGDDFIAEGFHVEGFVCPLSLQGSWSSNVAGNQSNRVTVRDISYNNVEFLLFQELYDVDIDQIVGGVISETQTSTSVRSIHAPSGDLSPNYKAPHGIYGTNRVTAISQRGVRVGVVKGDNRYSSIVKLRNMLGVTVRMGAIETYARGIDIDGCDGASIHLPTIRGALDVYPDSQASAINIYNTNNATVSVDLLECISDLTRVISMRPGLQEAGSEDDPATFAPCENLTIRIGEMLTDGTAARSIDWISNRGGINCWVEVGHWRLRGEDDVYMYRARSSGTDVSPVVGCVGGGFKVHRITCEDAHLLNVAQLSAEDATVPANMLVEYSKATARGSVTYDNSTVIDGGTTNTVLVDGAKTVDFTVTPSFATPGDSTLTVTASSTYAEQRGHMVKYWFTVTFNVSAFTTASGELRIALTGLPTPASTFTNWPGATARWGTIDVGSNVRDLGPLLVSSGGPYVTFRANTDNSTGALINTGEFNPAGATGYLFSASGEYRIA